jgi:hypothetical protein
MEQAEYVLFVNVSINSGPILGPVLIHYIASNPFWFAGALLFNLQDSLDFTIESYASLFETIVLRLTRRESIISNRAVSNHSIDLNRTAYRI